MKRFWKQVDVVEADGGHGLALDGRRVNTPGRLPLVVPSRALAEAIAAEWVSIEQDIDPRAMPLTGLANAAVERVAPDPRAFAGVLARYGESDLLCYRADQPPELVARQAAAWDPLLDWAARHYGVRFEIATGVMHVAQPDETVARLSDAILTRPPFELVGLAPVVTITGSLVAALALAEDAATPDTIWGAALVDELWQEEQWGADPIAVDARAAREAEYQSAVRFLDALAQP